MSRKRNRRFRQVEQARCHWTAAVLIALFGTILFANTLGHELLFDDVTLILQNPFVTSLDWKGIVWDSGYRPVRTLTYALNYAISGEDPFSYHLVNVLLHGLNVLFLFRLVWLLSASNLMAGVAAGLFAAHPVQTAAVAYVSGRKDLLAACFVFAAMALFLTLRVGTRHRLAAAAGSALAFLLALGSKEVAIVFPALLLAVDAVLDWRSSEEPRSGLWSAAASAVKRAPILYGTFVVVAAAGLYWALAVSKASRMEQYWGGSLETNLGTSFKLFVHYLKLSLVPYPLLADYLGEVFPVSTGFAEAATLLSVLATAAYLGMAVWLFRRSALISAGMIWFLVCLVPVLQLIPFHELAADHFLYLPLAGWALAVAALAEFALKRYPAAAWPSLLVLILVYSGMTVDRNADWKDKQTLWEATYRSAPRSYRANANLGQIYFNQGLAEKGIEFTRRSLELAPGRALPHANLGAMYYTIGRERRLAGQLDEAAAMQAKARTYLEKAVELEPRNPFTLSNLANTYKEDALILDERGQKEAALAVRLKARDLLDRAFRLRDRRKEVQAIWMNYAGLYLDCTGGRYPTWRSFWRLFPRTPPGTTGWGSAAFRLAISAVPFPIWRRQSVPSRPRNSGKGWRQLTSGRDARVRPSPPGTRRSGSHPVPVYTTGLPGCWRHRGISREPNPICRGHWPWTGRRSTRSGSPGCWRHWPTRQSIRPPNRTPCRRVPEERLTGPAPVVTAQQVPWAMAQVACIEI
jgi:tetratricopeptide (TPR) repeat protein